MKTINLSKNALINYSICCDHTYNSESVQLSNGWKVLNNSNAHFGTTEPNGYFGVLYVNHETKEVFCAHRGTVINPWTLTTTMHNLIDDVMLGFTNEIPGGISNASAFATYGREQAKLLGYDFCQGGHSLGGFWGSLDALLHNERCFAFDAPSIFSLQQKNFPNVPSEYYAKQVHVLSSQNLINTCNQKHFGSIVQLDMPNLEKGYADKLFERSDLIDGKSILFSTVQYNLSAHSIANMSERLAQTDYQPQVTFSAPDETLPEYTITFQSDTNLKTPGINNTLDHQTPTTQNPLPRSLERLMPFTPAAYAEGIPLPMLNQLNMEAFKESTLTPQSKTSTATPGDPDKQQHNSNETNRESFVPSDFYLIPNNTSSHSGSKAPSTSNMKITLQILGSSSGGITAQITYSAELGWPGLIIAGSIFGLTYLAVTLMGRAEHAETCTQGNIDKIYANGTEVDDYCQQLLKEYDDVLNMTDPEEQKIALKSLLDKAEKLRYFVFNTDKDEPGKKREAEIRSTKRNNKKDHNGVKYPAPKQIAQKLISHYDTNTGPFLTSFTDNIEMNLLETEDLRKELLQDNFSGNLKNDALIRYKNLCLSNASTAYNKENDLNQAILLCSNGLELLPDDIDLKIARGDFYLLSDEAQNALKDYQDAKDLEPENFYAYAKIITCHEELSQWPEMLAIITLAKEIFSTDDEKMVDLLIKESFAHDKQGDFISSIAAIDEALKHPSDYQDALNSQKAMLYLKQNEKVTKEYIAYCEEHGDHLEVLIRVSSHKIKDALPGFIEKSRGLIQSTLDALAQCDHLPVIEPTETNETPEEHPPQESQPQNNTPTTTQPTSEQSLEDTANENNESNISTTEKLPTPKEILTQQLKQAMEQFCGYLVQEKITDLQNTKLMWDTGQLSATILSDILNHYFPESETLPFFQSFAAHGIRVASHYYEVSLIYLTASYKQFAEQFARGLADQTMQQTDINSVTSKQIEAFTPKISALQKTIHKLTYIYLGARLLEATVGLLDYSSKKLSKKLPETLQQSRIVTGPAWALEGMHRLDKDYCAPTLNAYAIVSAVLSIALNCTPLAVLNFPFELIVFVPGTRKFLFGDSNKEQPWHTNRLSLFTGHFLMSMNADLPTIISKYSAVHGNTILQWMGKLLVNANVSDSKIKSFLNIGAKTIIASRGLLLLLAFLYAVRNIKAELMVRHFHNEMLALDSKDPQELAEASIVFGMVKEIFQNNKSFQTAENWSLYVLAMYYEYTLANKFILKSIPASKEMFFCAISVYVKDSVLDLRDKVAKQIEAIRIQRDNADSEEPTDNERIEIKHGFELELNALEQALGRPIIVLIQGAAPIFPKKIPAGEPIFILYNPNLKHFHSLLVRESYAFPAYQYYEAQQRRAKNKAIDQEIVRKESTLPQQIYHELQKTKRRQHESTMAAIRQHGVFAAKNALQRRIKELEKRTDYSSKASTFAIS